MNWGDIFYPGNPERRENLIRKSQEVAELMKNNFRATNDLSEVLREHLGMYFSPICVNEKATVKDNCDVLIQRIREIQAKVEKIDEELKVKLEPTLYESLKKDNLSMPDRLKVTGALRIIEGCIAGVAAVYVVGWLFQNVAMLACLTGVWGVIAAGVIGCLVFGVLCMGIDMILGAIFGNIERDRLEKALREYDEALKDFRPASEKYQKSIMEVEVTIKFLKKKNLI